MRTARSGTGPQPSAPHADVLALVTAFLDEQLRSDPAHMAALIATHDPLLLFHQ